MNDKANKILDVASELFFNQGYRNTSIQTIADQCGIAKGSIYLHFKSKERMLIALLKRLDDRMIQDVEIICSNSHLSPKEKFREQLRTEISLNNEHRQFHEIFTQDSIEFTPELYAFLTEARLRWQTTQQSAVLNYFGEEIKHWQTDLSVMINGMVNEYASYWLIEKVNLPIDRAVDMIMFAIECLAQGLKKKKPPAALANNTLPNQKNVDEILTRRLVERRHRLSNELINLTKNLNIKEPSELNYINQTLESIAEEIIKEQPNTVLLRSMIAALREYEILLPIRTNIAKEFSIKLV